MKSKLRAALTEMWDAELYLRLFKPEESLPYQYKALKLIKEIKNHARIYVHRMGFDAPPINEAESRLSGELEEVHGESFRSTYDYQETLPETKALIAAISNLMTQELPVSNTIQDQLQQTGNEIAGLAITEPGKYLKLLSTIRDISDQEQLQKNELDALKSKLVLIVPKATMPPKLESQPSHELLEEFIKETNPVQTMIEFEQSVDWILGLIAAIWLIGLILEFKFRIKRWRMIRLGLWSIACSPLHGITSNPTRMLSEKKRKAY